MNLLSSTEKRTVVVKLSVLHGVLATGESMFLIECNYGEDIAVWLDALIPIFINSTQEFFRRTKLRV